MTFSLKTLSEYGRQVSISPLFSETVLKSYTVLLIGLIFYMIKTLWLFGTVALSLFAEIVRQVYNQTVWQGGPVEAVLHPEFVEPQLGLDGRPFHIVDCRIDLGALEGHNGN